MTWQLCLGLLFVVSRSESVWLLYSPATPFNVSLTLSLSDSQSFPITPVYITSPKGLPLPEGLVLDYLYQHHLSEFAQRRTPPDRYFNMWRDQHYPQVFAAYLRAFNFTQVLLVSDTDQLNSDNARYLYAAYPDIFRDTMVLPEDMSIDFALQFVGRYVKPRGINLIALLLSPQVTSYFLMAMKTKKMLKVGHAYILSQTAGRCRYLSEALPSGLLVIGEDYETETSVELLEAKRINGRLLGAESSYSLFYTVGSTLVKAASSPENFGGSVVFPGNSTAIPQLSKSTIRAWVNYEIKGSDGTLYPLSAQVMRGFQVAFEEVNTRADVFPYYHLQDVSVHFNGMVFEYNYTYTTIKAALSEPAVIYMSVPLSQDIMGTTRVLHDLNVTLPIVTGSQDNSLSDPATYPMFVRPRVSNQYVCYIVARMMRFFGWSNAAVIFTDDHGDLVDAYYSFVRAAELFNIKITNPEPLRKLPSVLDSSTAGVVNSTLEAIIHSRTRILVIFHHYQFQLMEQLYDLGVREGYVQIYITGLVQAIIADPKYTKRRVVSKGALQFYPRIFVGSVGAKVKQELIAKDPAGIFPNTCVYYDSAYLYFYATEYLLNTGHDYEDAVEIMRAMRGTHFHGCSGFVTIESGSNNRGESEMVITNLQYNSDNDTAELKEVGSFNPFSTHPYQITSPIQWPDGNVTYADLKPLFQDCSFLLKLVRKVALLVNVGFYVHFGIGAYTLAITLFLTRQWKHLSPQPLHSARPISIEDVLVFIVVVCDYFQIASVGPDLGAIGDSFIQRVSAAVGLDLAKVVNLANGVYWMILDVTLGLVGVWVVVCLLEITELANKLCECYTYWAELLLSAVGNLLFLPIVSILSSVFLCDSAISDDLTESFSNKDCHEFCWSGMHLGYSIGSGIALLIYIPLGIYTRPVWQELQSNVHIKARPLSLLIKAAVQVLFIVGVHVLKEDNPSAHAYFYFTVLFLYLVFLLLVPFYNYKRLNLWQTLLAVSLLSLTVTAHVCNLHGAAVTQYLFPVLVAVQALLGILGLAMQTFIPRFRSRLHRVKGMDLRGLFVFAFTWGARAQYGLQDFYSVNQISSQTRHQPQVVIQSYQ